MKLSSWCDRVIRWGFYLLFALVPLLFTPWNYELFEFNKMIGVYMLTIIITGAWMVKSIAQKEFRIARTPLDVPILLFLSSQLLSALFSMDPHVSWFGYYSRFNGGMFSIMSYVLLYYAFVSNCLAERDPASREPNLLKVALGSGAIVALYGVAERLGIDKHLWVQDVQNRVFSSLGQPNWLAAYLVALLPLAMAFGLNSQFTIHNVQQGKKNFYWSLGFGIWTLTAALFFAVLLFTRSRSGLLGFAVADVVFWGLVFARTLLARLQGESLRVWRTFIIIHLAFVILAVLFGPTLPIRSFTRSPIIEATPSASYTAPLLETGGTESGTIRKYVWQGAINAWQSSLKTYLVGTGTETFAFAFYEFRPVGHNLTSEWDFLYNKAHNEYLNYLATTGILGLGSYLLFIGAFIVWFFKSQYPISNIQQGNKNLYWSLGFGHWILQTALFAGWTSILVTNFFGFSVVILQVFLFLFPAMVIAADRVKSQKQDRVLPITITAGFFMPLVLLASLVLLVLLSLGWYADTLYALGYRQSRAGQYDLAVDSLSRAFRFNPGEPLFADELGMAYAGLATNAIEEKHATRAAQLVRMSLASSDRAITTSPKNVNFWKTRTKIYYTFTSFDPAYHAAAIEALERAQTLSPKDPKITYNLAILHGRSGDNTRAIALLQSSIDLKPNYRDAYYALWVFYTEEKKSEFARTVLTDYLTKVDPGDKDFLERLHP